MSRRPEAPRTTPRTALPRVPAPPRLLRRLIRRLIPAADRDDLIVELDLLYAARVRRRGRRAARRWYSWQLASFALHLGLDRLRRRRAGGPGRRPDGRGPSFRAAVLLDSLITDLRLGFRRLLARPGTTLATVITLGVGIAGAGTTYMLADWVLLRRVPGVAEPDRLVTVRLESSQSRLPHWRMSHVDLERLAALMPSLADLSASSSQAIHFATSGDPARLPGELVTADYFETLGVAPAAGRTFAADEGAHSGGAPVAVISHRLWQRQWAGDPAAVGAEVRINGVPHTVVGVAPPGFHGAELPGEAEVWLPAGNHANVLRAGVDLLERPTAPVWEKLIARTRSPLPASRTREMFDRAMDRIRDRYERHSFIPTQFVFRVYPGVGLAPSLRLTVPRTLGIVGTAAGLLLLLSWVNVTSLGLARAASRRSTTAICRALGAGRGRLLRERLVEGLLVGAGAAMVGLGVTLALGPLLRDASLSRLGVRLEGMGLGGRGLVVTVLVGLAAGVISSLWPALSGAGVNVVSALRSASHGAPDAWRSRGSLVVAQVALSVVLLVGAGLLARTLWNLRAVDLGIPVDEILAFHIDPAIQGYDGRRTTLLIDELIRELESDPTVADAGAVFTEPLGGRYFAAPYVRSGGDWETGGVFGNEFQVTPSWFRAAGIELVAGRHFRQEEWQADPRDAPDRSARDATAPGVVILGEAFARALFPGAAAAEVVGRGIEARGGRRRKIVVGIVRDARLGGLAAEELPLAYLPWAGGSALPEEVTFFVRGQGRPHAAAGAVREVVRRVDPFLPVYSLEPLVDRVGRHLSEQRFVARGGVLLAVLGLLLAAVGLYSALSHAVVERTREIGIRAALGARPGDILSMIVRSGLRLAGLGAGIGLLAAPWLVRHLEDRLFGLESLDPSTYVAGVTILLAVALVASVLPAARAVRVDPMKSLRSD